MTGMPLNHMPLNFFFIRMGRVALNYGLQRILSLDDLSLDILPLNLLLVMVMAWMPLNPMPLNLLLVSVRRVPLDRRHLQRTTLVCAL